MTLSNRTHKAPCFCVPNIFPPYRAPPSVAQDLALALTQALPRELALTRPHARAVKGKFFSKVFRKKLEFLTRIFFCNKLFLKFVKTKKVHTCVQTCVLCVTLFLRTRRTCVRMCVCLRAHLVLFCWAPKAVKCFIRKHLTVLKHLLTPSIQQKHSPKFYKIDNVNLSTAF